MSHRRPLRSLLIAAIALIALGAGACGSSGDKTGSPATSTAKSVDIKDFAFKPDKMTVKTGTKVTWTNGDGFDHTVTATDKSFDSDHIAPKASFTRTFDQPGTFTYLCNIHNSMTGTVIVTP